MSEDLVDKVELAISQAAYPDIHPDFTDAGWDRMAAAAVIVCLEHFQSEESRLQKIVRDLKEVLDDGLEKIDFELAARVLKLIELKYQSKSASLSNSDAASSKHSAQTDT